jgi:hypothetical protein
LKSELIATTDQPPFRIIPRVETFERLKKSIDENQSSIKVSFVGDTAAGKSFIITHLMSFDDRVRHRRHVFSFSKYEENIRQKNQKR